MSNADRPTPAISTVSDLETSGWQARQGEAEGGEPTTEVTVEEAKGLDRPLPAPMHMRLHGGEIVTLRELQVFADTTVIRPGERGKALYPSSQAAANSRAKGSPSTR